MGGISSRTMDFVHNPDFILILHYSTARLVTCYYLRYCHRSLPSVTTTLVAAIPLSRPRYFPNLSLRLCRSFFFSAVLRSLAPSLSGVFSYMQTSLVSCDTITPDPLSVAIAFSHCSKDVERRERRSVKISSPCLLRGETLQYYRTSHLRDLSMT